MQHLQGKHAPAVFTRDRSAKKRGLGKVPVYAAGQAAMLGFHLKSGSSERQAPGNVILGAVVA